MADNNTKKQIALGEGDMMQAVVVTGRRRFEIREIPTPKAAQNYLLVGFFQAVNIFEGFGAVYNKG